MATTVQEEIESIKQRLDQLDSLKQRLDQIEQAWQAPIEAMTQDQLNALLAAIQEEIEERNWDYIWQKTHESPEAIAYETACRAEILEEHARGETIKYVKGKSLAELFQQEV